MTVGMIGFGRLGKLVAPYIARETPLVVHDRRRIPRRYLKKNMRSGSLPRVASLPVVVLAVPASSLRPILRLIAPHLQRGAIVVDVCAVKVEPVRWMKAILPPDVHILGTHPLFGPDTAGTSLRGHQVVLCPARITPRLLAGVKRLLRREGLSVTVMSPDRHDRMIAETILLTQYLGRLAAGAHLRRWRHATETYYKLLSIMDVSRRDSAELFNDIRTYNRYAKSFFRAMTLSRKSLEGQIRPRSRVPAGP